MLDITIDKRNIEKIMTESLLSRLYVQEERTKWQLQFKILWANNYETRGSTVRISCENSDRILAVTVILVNYRIKQNNFIWQIKCLEEKDIFPKFQDT